MKEIITYMTDDGKIFHDECEAELHERKLYAESLFNLIHLYNYNKEEIPFYNFENWKDAFYIYFKGTQKDAKTFSKIWEDYYSDWSPINERHYDKGLYFYKDDHIGWEYVPDRIKFYSNLFEEFENKINEE